MFRYLVILRVLIFTASAVLSRSATAFTTCLVCFFNCLWRSQRFLCLASHLTTFLNILQVDIWFTSRLGHILGRIAFNLYCWTLWTHAVFKITDYSCFGLNRWHSCSCSTRICRELRNFILRWRDSIVFFGACDFLRVIWVSRRCLFKPVVAVLILVQFFLISLHCSLFFHFGELIF